MMEKCHDNSFCIIKFVVILRQFQYGLRYLESPTHLVYQSVMMLICFTFLINTFKQIVQHVVLGIARRGFTSLFGYRVQCYVVLI